MYRAMESPLYGAFRSWSHKAIEVLAFDRCKRRELQISWSRAWLRGTSARRRMAMLHGVGFIHISN
jgi:hypothetical protein